MDDPCKGRRRRLELEVKGTFCFFTLSLFIRFKCTGSARCKNSTDASRCLLTAFVCALLTVLFLWVVLCGWQAAHKGSRELVFAE